MGTGAITSYVDVAQIVLYLFWIFFAGVVYYLIREGHREGYPMDTDRGTIEGWPRAPEPKTYKLHDGSEVQVPRNEAPQPLTNAQRTYRAASSPIEPVGNPLSAGIGPGSWSNRADHPDLDHHGAPKIVPLSGKPAFGVSSKDPDPRGMTVYDNAGDAAGTVRDLWIDQGEMLFRYLEVEIAGGQRRLLPMTFASITKDGVFVHAIMAEHYAGVPTTKSTNQITLLEEEKIAAYYGAGLLYATPDRAEPLI
jgi:photosynthetic reaction center H subunit